MKEHPLLANPSLVELMSEGVALGIFLVSASPLVAEACSTRGIDFIVIDMEASPADRSILTQCLQTLSGTETFALARLANSDRTMIEAALDAGAQGIIVPKVSSAADAQAIVNAACYPPVGSRGLNPIRCSGYFTDLPRYFAVANSCHLRGVQIETAEGLHNVDEIAATPGIDMLFVGCGDLAAQLGHIGEVDCPDMQQAIDKILEVCRKNGKIPGIFAYSKELAKKYMAKGYQFIAFDNDIKLLVNALESALKGLTT